MTKTKYILYCSLVTSCILTAFSLFNYLHPSSTEAGESCTAPDPPIFLHLDGYAECGEPGNGYICENSTPLLKQSDYQFSFCYLSGSGFADLDESTQHTLEVATCRIEESGWWSVIARTEYGFGTNAQCYAHCIYIPKR